MTSGSEGSVIDFGSEVTGIRVSDHRACVSLGRKEELDELLQLACLCIPSERAILTYIRGQATENEEKYTHDAIFDGGDAGNSACG